MARKKSKRGPDPAATYFGLLEYYSSELRTRQYQCLGDVRKAINRLTEDLKKSKCLLPPNPFPRADRNVWVKKLALKLWQQNAGRVKDAAVDRDLGLKSVMHAMSNTRQSETGTHHVLPAKTLDDDRLPARFDTLSSFYNHLYRQEPQASFFDTSLPQHHYAYGDYATANNRGHHDSLMGQQQSTLPSPSGDRKRKTGPESGPGPMYTPRKRSKLETMGDAELYNHKLAAQQQKDAARKLWEDAVIDEEMAQQEMNVRSSRVPEGGSTTSFLVTRRDYTATQGNVEELEDDIM